MSISILYFNLQGQCFFCNDTCHL